MRSVRAFLVLGAFFEEADVKAGWIKLAASDGGLTEKERKCLRAAARAGAATDSTIGCHSAERHRGPRRAGYRGKVGLPSRALRLDTRRP